MSCQRPSCRRVRCLSRNHIALPSNFNKYFNYINRKKEKYDSCIYLKSYNTSITYQFTIHNRQDFHPRYCLEFCTKYEQKNALINNDRCLCTNQAMKGEQDNIELLIKQSCSQKCAANYFYSCGNTDNSSIYSMYILQPKCRHGKIDIFYLENINFSF